MLVVLFAPISVLPRHPVPTPFSLWVHRLYDDTQVDVDITLSKSLVWFYLDWHLPSSSRMALGYGYCVASFLSFPGVIRLTFASSFEFGV